MKYKVTLEIPMYVDFEVEADDPIDALSKVEEMEYPEDTPEEISDGTVTARFVYDEDDNLVLED